MAPSSESLGSCIIVGGGPGGVHVATTIAKTCGATVDVTIVDRQNYMDWSLASPRMLVAPDDIDQYGYCMPLDKVCEFVGLQKGKNKTTFVQAAVTQVGPKSVTLDNGKTLEADVIVVAIGGQYASGAIWKPTPDLTTRETRIAAFRTLREKIANSKHVVVTGAGPSGVEVAGELKAAFPDLQVTMVGSLLPNSPEVLQIRVKTALEGMGVVVKEGRVDAKEPDSDGTVKTRDGGTTIENVDLILNAAGFTFKGKDIADDTLQKDVTDRGQFNCRHTLQLASTDSVFCCGDVLAVPEGYYADVKGLQHADMTAETVGKNVVAMLQQKPLADFAWSKTPINKPMMTALGPKIAVGYMGLPNFMENFLGRTLKCKDYYMSLKKSGYGKGKTW
ncbi:Apoptosis-inducing factor 2 [Seminavis robusta]|uniref:Apoptosis-inducing factor 2 n=1 Tax=Seminavis robusta TaxID=568900 RepID=A0A9N8HRW6_9STRA|nr:Apoptosis-inducing factor 2 [Seminavis robusta]|eukprot:Sro1446_g273500.1 Apoptosis-inducing factor 2 (390) ;mRNA; f:24023-25192